MKFDEDSYSKDYIDHSGSILVKQEYRGIQFGIYRINFLINLKPVITREFDIIVGMDWLSINNAQICAIRRM